MNIFKLIIGLGNPGPEYSETRHNAGFWLLDTLAKNSNIQLVVEPKYFGVTGKGLIGLQSAHLLKPYTFMNRSGQSALAIAQFYKIEPQEILVVHDELDVEPGQIRLKLGGGHGGHNGLRDLHRVLGPGYARIRIGIGHPGHKSKVHDYVLSKASSEQRDNIAEAIDHALTFINDIVRSDWDQAMNVLHQR
ncbi:MAG: aminoacyl-tRNA hydrolase [Gammaproteobacteria bacterium]|nr:aminoacyl-tRNA hydrolase [Gammaproteobacteria bacterium]